MSCYQNEYWRLVSKYSTVSGATPSIPPSQDHTDGTWSPTDLYIGEIFINAADDKVWVRTLNGIIPLGTASGTGSYIGDYVSKSLGGTYSGAIYAPTMSSITFRGTTYYGDVFEGLTTEATFNGTFIGDGSGLTGITAVWTGGTVSNPVYFTNTLDLTNDLTIDGAILTNNSYIDIQDDVWVNGGVSASYFVGDGSLLTNLPTGSTANDYTTDAYLDGSTLKFDRTDLVDAYSVDLSPIMSTNSISGVNFDGTFYTIYLEDGTEWTVDMTTFNSLSLTGAITADEFNGGTFYGTFVGTYSNDIYTTGATLVGYEEIFTRTDGSTYSVDLSSLVSGSNPTLEDVLGNGELSGNHNIFFPNNWGVKNSSGVLNSTGLSFDSDSVFIFAGTGSVDDYGSRATIAATKNGSAVVQVQNDVEFNMNLGGLGAGLFTIYGYTGFKGIEYGSDYSANYTNRSLVDKEYVDSLTPPTPTLESVLAVNNESGTYSIIMGTATAIKTNGGTGRILLDSLGDGDIVKIDASDGASNYGYLAIDGISGEVSLFRNDGTDISSIFINSGIQMSSGGGRSVLNMASYGVNMQNTDPSQNDLLNAVYADETGCKLESYDTIGNYSLVKAQQSNIQMIATDGSANNQIDINGSLFQVNGPDNINLYSNTSGVFRADTGSSLSELNLSGSAGYILNTAGEGRNTWLDSQYDYAEMKQDQGSSVIRSQVSLDNGFYQSQYVSTGISKGVSKTNFTSLQTTDGATTSVVWPLSGLEVGTTAVGIKATVTGIKSDDTKAYLAELYAAVRMNGYAVTIFGGVDKLEKSEFTTASSTIEIESSTVAIRVIGEASTTIRWSVKYELIYSV